MTPLELNQADVTDGYGNCGSGAARSGITINTFHSLHHLLILISFLSSGSKFWLTWLLLHSDLNLIGFE